MARDYSAEEPLQEADRVRAKRTAAAFRYRRQFALTIVCEDEADQEQLHAALVKRYPKRRIRVVVS